MARKNLLAAINRMTASINRDVFCPDGESLAVRQVGRMRFHLKTALDQDKAHEEDFQPIDVLYPRLHKEFMCDDGDDDSAAFVEAERVDYHVVHHKGVLQGIFPNFML